MRQIGMAMRMYSNEFGGAIPPGDLGASPEEYGVPSPAPSPAVCFWSFMDLVWAKGYVKHAGREANRPGASPPGLPMGSYGVNYPSAERGVFACPSETRTSGTAFPWNFALHYRLNVEADPTRVPDTNGGYLPSIARDKTTGAPFYGFHRNPIGVKWSYLKQNKILVAEAFAAASADARVYYPAKADGVTPSQVTLRHGKSSTIDKDKLNGANYLFGDGHVEYSMDYHRARFGTSGTPESNENFVKWWDHGDKLPNSVY
jgi:prepilin-type processing-associated H-X9-DG protein